MSVWDGEEATEVGRCGDAETDAYCFLGVRDADDRSAIIQVIGAHYIVHRKRLDSSGAEYEMGAGKVGTDSKDIGEIRVR